MNAVILRKIAYKIKVLWLKNLKMSLERIKILQKFPRF